MLYMFYVHVVPHVVHVVNNVVHCHFAIVCNTVIPVTLRVNGSRNITVPTGPKCCRIIVTINKDGGHLVATISPERDSDHTSSMWRTCPFSRDLFCNLTTVFQEQCWILQRDRCLHAPRFLSLYHHVFEAKAARTLLRVYIYTHFVTLP